LKINPHILPRRPAKSHRAKTSSETNLFQHGEHGDTESTEKSERFGVSPGAAKKYARRSEEMAAIEEMLRHSGLDPESSSSIKFSGASRRRKRFWIPGQARNDEVLGCSPDVGFGIGRRSLSFDKSQAIFFRKCG
jgi:hypothetical protein